MSKIKENPIREMLERTRRMPHIKLYRTEDSLPEQEQTITTGSSYLYEIHLPSLFVIAKEETPSMNFLKHRALVFSARQEIGQADLSGKLEALTYVRTERGDLELRFELEGGMQLQYGATGDRRKVIGDVIRAIYPA